MHLICPALYIVAALGNATEAGEKRSLLELMIAGDVCVSRSIPLPLNTEGMQGQHPPT